MAKEAGAPRLPNQTFDFPPAAMYEFGHELGRRGLEYEAKPFQLRAGGESHWYLDLRRALCTPFMVSMVGKLLVAKTYWAGIDYSVLIGMGIGGLAPVGGIHMESPDDVLRAEANNDNSPGQRYGYGIWGAKVEGKKVLVADDTLTTGGSLITTIDMTIEAGGIVEDAVVVVDRSNGMAQRAVKEARDVNVHVLYEMKEDDKTATIEPVF